MVFEIDVVVISSLRQSDAFKYRIVVILYDGHWIFA